MSCRSRRKQVLEQKEKKVQVIKKDSVSVEQKKDSVIIFKEIKKTEHVKKDENSGDIIIKGKSDSLKDFNYHNIINGDTISLIHIEGNAIFEIKNKWQKKQQDSEVSQKESNLNVVAKIARKAVAKKTIDEVAKEIKQTEKQTTATGFQWPVYLIAGIIFLVAIVLIIIIKFYLKR